MEDANTLSVVCDRQKLSLDIRTILYIIMHENVAEIHCIGGKVYRVHITLEKLEEQLGARFLKPHRSRLVSVMAIHDITDKINLNNGERVSYVARRKKELIAELMAKRSVLIQNISGETRSMPTDGFRTTIAALTQSPLPLRISKWCWTRGITRWTGFSATEISPWHGWKRFPSMS